MASTHPRLLFLILATIIILSPSSATADGSPKVSLALYYETLCPFCSRFIVNHLSTIFEDGLISIIDLDLVPYGNARIKPNGTITCQHGEYECLLNTVESCAIYVEPDLNKHFPFINCVEKLVVGHKYQDWETCFSETGLDSKAVSDCYKGSQGHKLELQYAAQTNALKPPHKYVPWVVVNGQPLYDDYEDFKAKVCAAYKGEPPKACSKPSDARNMEMKTTNHVTYANEITSFTSMEDDELEIKMVV